ncbi:MAG: hypothetical protein MHM6MM_008010 [Cercozoa sp. M6MM]
MECVVCKKDGAKYRCATCRANYCSGKCCRIHRETCEAPVQQTLMSQVQPPAKRRRLASADEPDISSKNGDDTKEKVVSKLTDEHLSKLDCDDVNAMLQDKELRKSVRRVLLSKNVVGALRFHLHNNAQVHALAALLMKKMEIPWSTRCDTPQPEPARRT